MIYVAAQNLDLAEARLKASPQEASKMFQKLGDTGAKQLVRYLAAEESRSFIEDWELAQLVLGLVLAGVLFLGVGSRLLTGLTGAILLLTVFQHFKLTPELNWLGRSIDFIPWTAESLQRDQFWRLHTVYDVIEGAKGVLGVVTLGFLFAMRRRPRRSVKIDAVDDPHHRHVNR